MIFSNNEPDNYWGSRRIFLMALLCQIIGLPVYIGIVNTANNYGATGYILAYIAVTLIFGIPLLYMEFIISQFTARDCIDVWKIYPCVSHIGYLQVGWQVIVIIYNHLINSFLLHYLLISFENPPPYFICGQWANRQCNMLSYNFTLNYDCIRLNNPPPYCDRIFTTFPEYQYWRYKLLGRGRETYIIAWRLCLPSCLICVFMYLSCFKRKQSVKWVVEFFVMYPILGYFLLLMGSMLQKGVVEIYQDSLDSDLDRFFQDFRMSTVLIQISFSLEVGSGMTFNLASRSTFRAPCYSNAVIAVVVSAAVSVLAICTTAMMSCPYAFQYGIDPEIVLKAPMSLLYEKTPRFLSEFQYKYFWILLTYSCHVVLGVGTNVIYVLHLLEMLVARIPSVAKYPGLTVFLEMAVLYIGTIPLLSDFGMDTMLMLRRCSCVVSIFIAVLECVVFVLCYGLDKFTEDVHFMEGLQPNKYTRMSWFASSITLAYTFVNEMVDHTSKIRQRRLGWYIIMANVGLVVVVVILKMLFAAYKKQFRKVIKLDTSWVPRDELLQRSRAMFTARAMTKEYLYRQYHLQAGIIARQKLSNCRTDEGEV